ncbi:MAG: hypothetical protein ACO3DY_05870 [Candidatus Nanopelagicaceae bacterium]
MTDISNLNYNQIQELEKQIQERKNFLKQSKDCAVGYKVTFCVKFNPYAHKHDELNSVEDFGDWLVNDNTRQIIEYFKLKTPDEDISGFKITEMNDEDKEEWQCFWENEE